MTGTPLSSRAAGETPMHADERLNALGQASGSAEVAAQTLAALKRALAGEQLRASHREALSQQAELLGRFTAASTQASDAPTLAATLAQEGPWTFRNLSSLRNRMHGADVNDDVVNAARNFLLLLAREPQP